MTLGVNRMKFLSLKVCISVLLIGSLAACSENANKMDPIPAEQLEVDGPDELDVIENSEDFLTYLADNDEELGALGLAGKKERKAKKEEEQKKKGPRKEAVVPQGQAKSEPKKNGVRKAPVAPVGEAKKEEKKKGGVVQKAKQAIKKQERITKKSIKQKNNLTNAMNNLKAVRAMPARGLLQAKAKCDAISQGVQFLKSTKSPARPFDGQRARFRAALKKQRAEILQVNKVTSCGAIHKLAASLPASAPEPQLPADEEVPAVDMEDEVADEETSEEVNPEGLVVDENGNVLSAETINTP